MTIPADILMPQNNGRFKYPFGTLKIGETFLVTIKEVADSVRVSAISYTKSHPDRHFQIYKVDQGWRVVRTK